MKKIDFPVQMKPIKFSLKDQNIVLNPNVNVTAESILDIVLILSSFVGAFVTKDSIEKSLEDSIVQKFGVRPQFVSYPSTVILIALMGAAMRDSSLKIYGGGIAGMIAQVLYRRARPIKEKEEEKDGASITDSIKHPFKKGGILHGGLIQQVFIPEGPARARPESFLRKNIGPFTNAEVQEFFPKIMRSVPRSVMNKWIKDKELGRKKLAVRTILMGKSSIRNKAFSISQQTKIPEKQIMQIFAKEGVII